MNISQERFDHITHGLLELIYQRHTELQQLEILLQERDARHCRFTLEYDKLKSDLIQANLDKEREQSLRFTAERHAKDAIDNMESWDKKFDKLQHLKDYESRNAQLMIENRDATIAALQATITQLKKRISKAKKQRKDLIAVNK